MEENNHILQVPQKTCCIMPTDTSCFLCGNRGSRRISVTVGSSLRPRNKRVCYSNHTADVGEENLRQCPINLKEGLQIDATQWRDLGKWQMNTCGYVPVAMCHRVSACVRRTESTFVCAEMSDRGRVFLWTRLRSQWATVRSPAELSSRCLPLRTNRWTPLGAAMLASVTWPRALAPSSPRPARWSSPVAAVPKTGGTEAARGRVRVRGGSWLREPRRRSGSGTGASRGTRGRPSPLRPRETGSSRGSRARSEPPRPGGMEEACQVSVVSNICSINILVHGNVKLGGKNKAQSSVQHSTLHRLLFVANYFPGFSWKVKFGSKSPAAPLMSQNLHYSAETTDKTGSVCSCKIYSGYQSGYIQGTSPSPRTPRAQRY